MKPLTYGTAMMDAMTYEGGRLGRAWVFGKASFIACRYNDLPFTYSLWGGITLFWEQLWA